MKVNWKIRKGGTLIILLKYYWLVHNRVQSEKVKWLWYELYTVDTSVKNKQKQKSVMREAK